MPAYANQVHVRFSGGNDPLTVKAASTINGGRFCSITDSDTGYPALTNTTANNIIAAHATAAGTTNGVARWDAATGEFTTLCQPGDIVQVLASTAVAKGVDVEVATGGKSVTKSSGVSVGKAITAGATDTLHYVLIY